MKKKQLGNNTLRIISGKWKGRKIHFPDSLGLRPTGDRIRETVFNWLMNDLRDARCLDLFAGSGALGFEAASRGAHSVVMVDANDAVINYLNSTKEVLKANNVDIVATSAKKFLASFSDKPFDIIFLDPPFNKNLIDATLSQLLSSASLREGSLFYVESEKEIGLPPPFFSEIKKQKSSNVYYSLYFYRGVT